MARSPSRASKQPSPGAGRPGMLLRLTGVLLLGVLVGVAMFLALTVGLQRLSGSQPADFDTDEGYLPGFVHDPPETVKTTEEYGPVGPVGLIFADDRVATGLTGTLPRPWVAVSSQTGEYRALVAPHLPAPGPDAMSVAPDGRHLAWAYDDGVVLYDPVRDTSLEVPLPVEGPFLVGRFSPDGERLAAYGAGVLHLVDTGTGDVVGELDDLEPAAARQAVWTPDGRKLTYVADGRLVTRGWDGGPTEQVRTEIRPGATVDWHPSGRRLVATRTSSTGTRVELFDVRPDGTLEPSGTVARPAYSLQRMLGFSSDSTVSAIGLGLETGGLAQLYRMSTESAVATDVTQLPAGRRFLTSLETAAEPLANGSAPFEEPDWPISKLAKLTISVASAVFAAGLALTRKPRHR